MTGLQYKRPLAVLVLLIFCVTPGCTHYTDPMDEAFDAATDATFPDGRWKVVPLAELVGSEDRFKGKEMVFFFADGRYDKVVVERIDSTFVYAWDQWDKNARKSLAKIKLQKVARAERYEGAMRRYKWYHWALVPVFVAVAVLLAWISSGGW